MVVYIVSNAASLWAIVIVMLDLIKKDTKRRRNKQVSKYMMPSVSDFQNLVCFPVLGSSKEIVRRLRFFHHGQTNPWDYLSRTS